MTHTAPLLLGCEIARISSDTLPVIKQTHSMSCFHIFQWPRLKNQFIVRFQGIQGYR